MMTISKELLDELLKGCERPEDLLGDAGLMKPALVKKPISPGVGRGGERGPERPRINAPSRPIYSAPSALRAVSAPPSFCPTATPRPCKWHLEEISSQVAPGAHAILIVDQAGWHTTGKLKIPPNITLLPLPPRSPELNPVENIWQFMRDNWLSNRVFESYDEIVEICSEAWKKLVDQPWTIMSIGLRKWAHGV